LSAGAASRQTVSACLIVRDEQERLPDALSSVTFCDEVIVVDGGSSDRTIELARASGARVIENPWPGFARQRNVAIDHAVSDWILEVDADERLVPELQREVQAFLVAPGDIDMGALPLRDRFLDGPLGPSARYPVYRYRLFRRDAYRHDETRAVHEGLWANGPVHAFRGDLEHILAGSLREAMEDLRSYASLQSTMTPTPGSPVTYVKGIVVRPAVKLVYRTIALGGWRDGWRGLLKIAIDCTSDALVWIHVARRGESAAADTADVAHFGERAPMHGSVRLVAVAGGERDVAAAATWLRAAHEAGADVGLIADRPVAGGDLHVRELTRVGPLQILRALDAENQLRPIDALVPWGSQARLLARLLSPARRGPAAPVPAATPPQEAVRIVTEATRAPTEAYAPPGMERSER